MGLVISGMYYIGMMVLFIRYDSLLVVIFDFVGICILGSLIVGQ
jgi:hypothetical protein